MGARQKPYREVTREPLEEGPDRLRSSTECDPEGRQRGDVLRTMRDVRESVAAHSPDHGGTESRDEAEQSHSACVYREATGRNRTPLLSTRILEYDDAGHAAAEPPLGTTSGLSLNGCDVRLVDRVSFEGADVNMVPIGDDETSS